MSSIGEVRSQLAEVQAHINSHQEGVTAGQAKADEGFAKLQEAQERVGEAIGLLLEAAVDFTASSQIVTGSAKEHLKAVNTGMQAIGVGTMDQAPARKLEEAVGEITSFTKNIITAFGRTGLAMTEGLDGRPAVQAAFYAASLQVDEVTASEFAIGAQATTEVGTAVQVANQAIDSFVL